MTIRPAGTLSSFASAARESVRGALRPPLWPGTPRASLLLGVTAALTAALTCSAFVGCNRPVGVGQRGRVLIIGIDGATMRAIDPLFAEGKLPNLRRIRDQGIAGPIRSYFPLLSPRIWTSVATGKTPAQHGIENWIHPSGEDQVALYYGYDRKGHALWNILSDQDMSVAVVNWLVTYPPERINGVMVSDHTFEGEAQGKRFLGNTFAHKQGKKLDEVHTPKEHASGVFPPEWNAKVLDKHHEDAVLTPFPNPFVEGAEFPPAVKLELEASFYDRDEQLVSVALQIEEEVKPKALMVLLQGIDRVSHNLWGYYEDAEFPERFAKPTPEQHKNAREAVERYYEFSDALIGRLVERYTDDDLVVVLSDHGFEPGRFAFMVTGVHESDSARDGVLFVRGKDIPHTDDTGGVTVNDVTPTVLAWLGLPAANDMTGKPAAFVPGPHPAPIATYETTKIEREEVLQSGGEASMMDKLKKLGYVDE